MFPSYRPHPVSGTCEHGRRFRDPPPRSGRDVGAFQFGPTFEFLISLTVWERLIMQLLWHQCAFANDYRTSILLTLTSTACLEVRHDSFLLFAFLSRIIPVAFFQAWYYFTPQSDPWPITLLVNVPWVIILYVTVLMLCFA